jgi:hypothetical protein
VLTQLGPGRLEATREHYLRYTLAVWQQLNQADSQNDPTRAVQAMHVMCLLFNQ